MASSSRSQIAVWPASALARLTWQALSVDVRWRPPPSVAIVTHLVTRLPARSVDCAARAVAVIVRYLNFS